MPAAELVRKRVCASLLEISYILAAFPAANTFFLAAIFAVIKDT